MTKEEAIKIFKEVREEVIAKETELSRQVFENLGIKAIDLAIKALEQQPSEDCISREEAIRVAEQGQIQGYEWQFKKLCTLPSVTPTRPNGKWKRISPAGIYECTNCNQVIMTSDIDCYKYCHGCGVRMEGEE